MIKAIETVYNGYRFRSRLEARWAVFFDTLGIAYEYEKEGYDLDGVYYLPDFWLPEQNQWVEIKGDELTQEDIQKVWGLTQSAINPVVVYSGQIKAIGHTGSTYQMCEHCDVPHQWQAVLAECPHCQAMGFLGNTRDCMDALPCSCWVGTCEKVEADHEYFHQMLDIMSKAVKTPRLIAAYKAARQARFEHGEKGKYHV